MFLAKNFPQQRHEEDKEESIEARIFYTGMHRGAIVGGRAGGAPPPVLIVWLRTGL